MAAAAGGGPVLQCVQIFVLWSPRHSATSGESAAAFIIIYIHSLLLFLLLFFISLFSTRFIDVISQLG